MADAKAVFDQAKSKGAKGDGFDKIEKKLQSIGTNEEIISANEKVLKDQLKSVFSLYNSGEFQQALEEITQLKQQYPNSATLYNICGATNRRLGMLDVSIEAYKKSIEIDPNHSKVFYNLGNALKEKGMLQEAINYFNKALAIKPNFPDCYNNLGLSLKELGKLKKAMNAFSMAISLNPNYAQAYCNLGNILRDTGAFEKAIAAYTRAISLKTDYFEAYNNLGNSLVDRGQLKEGMKAYKQALTIQPDAAEVFNNMAIIFGRQSRMEKARKCYIKALEIKPNYVEVYWNLSSTSKDICEAENWLERCVKLNPDYEKARLTLSALRYWQGERRDFNRMLLSFDNEHPYMRSFRWVFGLPNLPKLHFNRWSLFDQMVDLSKINRPFYEFGVWRGEAFKYLIKTFKKGYGFDTFEGLPEDWHNEKSGTYTSDGNIPKIEGGEFIVGKFEDTLPGFFSEPRPKASIINFDADLYSSTICALNFSKPVIDRHTILIFDEFIINENWEQDEYKALEEFCSKNNYTYEVMAISFFTKQVAVKLIGV
jgi:tetratricopeptide (TPR) repeat protein